MNGKGSQWFLAALSICLLLYSLLIQRIKKIEALMICDIRASRDNFQEERRLQMFLILAVVLVLVWLGSFTVLHVTGFLIHLLLIFAVISLIMHFVTGKRAA